MINEDKAFRMFCEKYVEKHKGQSMKVGGTEVAVLNNCTMIISIPEKNRLSINFTSKPFYINENLDMYEENKENE